MKILNNHINSAVWVLEQIGEPLPEGIDTWCWPELADYAKVNPRTLVKAKNFLKTLEPNQVIFIINGLTRNFNNMDQEWLKRVIENATIGDPAQVAYLLLEYSRINDVKWVKGILERCAKLPSVYHPCYEAEDLVRDYGVSKFWYWKIKLIHWNCKRKLKKRKKMEKANGN